MDITLFQCGFLGAVHSSPAPEIRDARDGGHAGRAADSSAAEEAAASSRNLDLLRSFAVLLVVGFHIAKFFNWRLETLRVTDFGLLGVMLFFVHTTLVLMFSLERQSAGSRALLFLPFMVRRCFRIYPLAALVVAGAYLFQIPSDLQFGGFHLLHQSAGNLLANLLLVQNVTLQKANPGILWSLPLELQMYLALPAMFLFARRARSAWVVMAFWCACVALWFAVGFASGVLPLADGIIRSPAEALLKFTRFAPCFLPGIVAYKLWRQPRILPALLWPVFLALCCAAFVLLSGRQPIESGWVICLSIGLGVSFFREMPENLLAALSKQIARYSYGIYLLHYFAIWVAFAVFRRLNAGLQIAIFVAVLASLSVLLYHAVEAPLIAAGVRISKRLAHRNFAPDAGSRRADPVARIRPALGRST